MKLLSPTLFAGFLSIMFSSCTAVTDSLNPGLVVRDCTGTYVKFDKDDYFVCNPDILKEYKDGEKVSVTFDNSADCPEIKYEVLCRLYHERKGMITVKTVK